MTPLFKRFGIDLDQLKILIINAIRIDFRESRGIGIKRRKISPIVWSLIFYLIMGSSMAVGLVMKATPFFYAFLLLS